MERRAARKNEEQNYEPENDKDRAKDENDKVIHIFFSNPALS